MRDYDFHTLNAFDFEVLVRDLLNAEEKKAGTNIIYKTFPAGKDKGIDLLYFSSTNSYEIIVQVKHYLKTSYSTLLSHLHKSSGKRTSEKDKLAKLKPNRYILVTSQALTLHNKEEIVKVMSPYIFSTTDIIDQIELNRLLGQHHQVEEDHYKLWFSSVTVFERILSNDVHGRSKQLEEDIQNRFQIYVVTEHLKKAEAKLQTNDFVVITGEPGTGKTTLAEMILYRLAGNNFQMYWIEKSVSEVDKLLKEDNSKQVFYFDDFLGHTKLEIETAKSNEKGLLHFIRRIKKYPNKYFVLTTRSSIFNQAEIESERFKNSDISFGKFGIEAKGFTLSEKIQIIKNHFYVNNIPDNYLSILDEKKMIEVAVHDNFSPRLIEYVTKQHNYESINPEYYSNYILGHLNNPQEIWLHAYKFQINDSDRFFLTTLFSFGEAVDIEFLQEAFESRVQFEISVNNLPRENDSFHYSLKKLLGSFIKFYDPHGKIKVQFINPSLEDFLLNYLSNNETEKLRIINSVIFIEQIIKRFRYADPKYLLVKPETFFYKRLSDPYIKTIQKAEQNNKSYTYLYLALITWMFYKNDDGIDLCLSHFKKVDYKLLTGVNFFHLFGFIQIAYLEIMFKNFFIVHFIDIITYLISSCSEIIHLEKIKNLFTLYDHSYSSYMKQPKNYSLIKSFIDDYYGLEISNEVENLKDYATIESNVWSVRDDFKSQIESAYELMDIKEEAYLEEFEEVNWNSICWENHMAELMRKDD